VSGDEPEDSQGARTVITHEGTCARCGKLVTREPGERWTDQYGRDRCRADWDDGECDVRTWSVREERRRPVAVPPMAIVTLFGLDADGQPVIVSDRRVPASDGAFYEETFSGRATVTRWRVSFSQAR
jgi:hypothetical protein